MFNSRLTNADSGSSQSFAYDDFGNVTSIGGQGVSVSPATNRLSATGTAYDSRGNLVAEPVAANWTRHSRYDLFNQQVAAWSTGTAAPSDAYAFAYDQAGERVLRYRVEGGAVQEARFFIRDEGGNVLTEFQWASTGLWTRMSDTAYLGRRPLVRMETSTGGDRTYTTLVTDHLDSVRAEIFDATYTSPSYNNIDYWPFGELVSHPASLKSKHLFTGHEREFTGSATGVNTLEGLDYMHARYYNLNLGRFLSVDPVGGSVGRSQSWNRYSYVLNNPLRFVDPTGEYGRGAGFTDEQWERFEETQKRAAEKMKKTAARLEKKAEKLDAKGKPAKAAKAADLRQNAGNLRAGAAVLNSDGSDGKFANAVDKATYLSRGGTEFGAAMAIVGGPSVMVNINHEVWSSSGDRPQHSIGHESLHTIGLRDQPVGKDPKAYKMGLPDIRKLYRKLMGTPMALINPDHIMDLVY